MSGSDPQRLFDRAPCGLVTARLDGIVVDVNETFLAWSGYSRREVVGRYFLERLTRASKLFFETRFVPMLQNSGEVREIALQLQRPDGSTLALFVNARYEREGEDRLIRMAVFDATSRLDYERLLLESRREAEEAVDRVRVLQEAAAAAAAAVTESHLSVAITGAAARATDAGNVTFSIFTADGLLAPVFEATPTLEVAPHERVATGAIPVIIPGPEQEALRLGLPVVCGSAKELAQRFPEFAGSSLARRVESCVSVPILDEDGHLGVISCWFARSREVSDSMVELLQALAALAAPVMRRVELQRRVEHLALNDRLTGLANRHHLEQRLEQSIAGALRRGRPLGVIFVDLDGFKSVNDTLGHATGDRALREISARIQAAVRRSDIAGRLGGDEFLIICEDVDVEVLQLVADRVREASLWGAPPEPERILISASVGLSHFDPAVWAGALDEPSVIAERLIQRADEAMYASKQSGKDRVTALSL